MSVALTKAKTPFELGKNIPRAYRVMMRGAVVVPSFDALDDRAAIETAHQRLSLIETPSSRQMITECLQRIDNGGWVWVK